MISRLHSGFHASSLGRFAELQTAPASLQTHRDSATWEKAAPFGTPEWAYRASNLLRGGRVERRSA